MDTINPIDLACPNCQAVAGRSCTAPTDTGRRPVRWFHYARTDAVAGWGSDHRDEG